MSASLTGQWQSSHIARWLRKAGAADVWRSSLLISKVSQAAGRLGSVPIAYAQLLAAFFIFFAVFSRRFTATLGHYDFHVRMDDLVFVVFLIVGLCVIRRYKQTSLDIPIIMVLLIVLVGMAKGFMTGTIASVGNSLLSLLKVMEYFVLMYLTVNILSSQQCVQRICGAFILSVVAVAVYGFFEVHLPHLQYPSSAPYYYRLFERGWFQHDANHVSSLLVFGSAVILGIIMWARTAWAKLCLSVTAGLALYVLALTYSRGSYVAAAIAIFGLLTLKLGKWGLLSSCAGATAVYVWAPHQISSRVESILTSLFKSSSSLSYRFDQGVLILHDWMDFPLLGVGLGARHRVFYENMYTLILGETGLLGFVGALLLSMVLVIMACQLFGRSRGWIKGFAAGYLFGFLALLIQSLTVVVFLVSKVAGPFWIMTGLMVWLWSDARLSPKQSLSN